MWSLALVRHAASTGAWLPHCHCQALCALAGLAQGQALGSTAPGVRSQWFGMVWFHDARTTVGKWRCRFPACHAVEETAVRGSGGRQVSRTRQASLPPAPTNGLAGVAFHYVCEGAGRATRRVMGLAGRHVGIVGVGTHNSLSISTASSRSVHTLAEQPLQKRPRQSGQSRSAAAAAAAAA